MDVSTFIRRITKNISGLLVNVQGFDGNTNYGTEEIFFCVQDMALVLTNLYR